MITLFLQVIFYLIAITATIFFSADILLEKVYCLIVKQEFSRLFRLRKEYQKFIKLIENRSAGRSKAEKAFKLLQESYVSDPTSFTPSELKKMSEMQERLGGIKTPNHQEVPPRLRSIIGQIEDLEKEVVDTERRLSQIINDIELIASVSLINYSTKKIKKVHDLSMRCHRMLITQYVLTKKPLT